MTISIQYILHHVQDYGVFNNKAVRQVMMRRGRDRMVVGTTSGVKYHNSNPSTKNEKKNTTFSGQFQNPVKKS
jgi:hypothetical protein